MPISTHLFNFVALTVLLHPFALIAQVLPKAPPEELGISSERLHRLEALMQSYVEKHEVAGVVTLIARRGKIAHFGTFGMADLGKQKPMKEDTIFRIASMTKPITSVAALMLYEEGAFLLNDPVSRYIKEFAEPEVLVPHPSSKTNAQGFSLVPANREITIRHLLSHTSGITYGFMERPQLFDLYREADISDGLSETTGTIGEMVRRLSDLPLYSQPGEQAEYGLSTDVLGYLIEVVSGEPLDEFFRKRIFEPLGMTDTHFRLPEEKQHRLASVYTPTEEGGITILPEGPVDMGPARFSATYPYKGPGTFFSGGAGLVSTAQDYAHFLQMLLNGGSSGDVRILSQKSIELMTVNHIGDMEMLFSTPGQRFGLGFAIVTDLGQYGELGSLRNYSWGGFFNTGFWVDSEEELFAIILTQLYPKDHSSIQAKFGTMVYQSIID